ncbi:RagB/SusD family nutrient uptake outer membrane protein [Halosquirtibacter xylanolyticus]|uniref:RagB/SusD family nutrient uptake outer membrane protein n=1 Tax=Halosquirtibacter xylanolyticus TaxID=3374599 RepID=UPI0037485329|nr:RagB/SusD family nutrient uptake outer membrane protein [Prolixibacteraceae bacterium]
MRKSYLILYLFILSVVATSCSKDFLDRQPLDQISTADYWSSSNDLELYANQFYKSFPSHGTGYGRGIFAKDNGSDNFVPTNFNNRLNGTVDIPSKNGGWGWGNIRKVNYFLENCDKVTGDDINRKSFIAEVRFFRAYYYYSLVKQFGDVPWYDHVLNTNSEELYKPRDPRNIVVDNIILDLDYAIENLKASKTQTKLRITKEVALLFKSRVCLYEGTWEKYHNGTVFGVKDANPTKYLELAASASKALIDMGSCQVYNDGNPKSSYFSLFNKKDYSSVSEVLLWRKYDVSLTQRHNLQRYLQKGTGGTGMSKDFCDSYLDMNGKPLALSTMTNSYHTLNEMVENRDPRFKQSLFVPGDIKISNRPNGAPNVIYELPPIQLTSDEKCTTGLANKKGLDTDYNQSYAHWLGTTGAIIFRYAEALLNYAEAKAELGSITQDDLDISINKLRDRVGMVHLELGAIVADPNWKFPTLTPIINEVRRERRIEMVATGYRFDDLMRWRAASIFKGKRPKGMLYKGADLEGKYLDDKGKDIIVIGRNLYIDKNGFIDPYQKSLPNGYGFDENRDYLKPFPSDQLTINEKLKQNPGWD